MREEFNFDDRGYAVVSYGLNGKGKLEEKE